jgi:hypothetical protein
MRSHGCGTDESTTHVLGCLTCGASCCAACAIHLESVTYCASCARSLLEVATVRASGPFALY